MSYNDGIVKAPKSTSVDATSSTEEVEGAVIDSQNDLEVFKKVEGAVDFRTVGWPMASIIFLKR